MAERAFKLAMVQMRVAPGEIARNLLHAAERVAEAAARGARIVVLPEALNCGWTDPSARDRTGEIRSGDACKALTRAAAAHRVFVCAGLIEECAGRLYNTAVLIEPGGELLIVHRKINELEIAHDLYAHGDSLRVSRTPLGCFGVMICSDAFAPGQVISRTLGLMGADMILSPCAWAVPADHDNAREPYGRLWRECYGPVARDFQLWIAGVSNVGLIRGGPWAGRQCIGCSLLIGPDGREVIQGPYGADAEAILYADIELKPRPARGDGWERLWAGR